MKTITLQDEYTRLKVTIRLEKLKSGLTKHEMKVIERSSIRACVNGLLGRIQYTDYGVESLKIR